MNLKFRSFFLQPSPDILMLSPVIFSKQVCWKNRIMSNQLNLSQVDSQSSWKKILKDEQENRRHPELKCQSLNTHIKAVL